MRNPLPTLVCLLASSAVVAAPPPPCGVRAPDRKVWPQGTMLWGTALLADKDDTSSVLTSVELGSLRLGGRTVKDARVEQGHLAAATLAPKDLAGARLQGRASNGQPVEVAICEASPADSDPSMLRYRLEIWNAKSGSWENPCVATRQVPEPRALAVREVWDERGARREEPGRFTFACETGVIAKCVNWGYKPWAMKEGRSLGELHQACTRMARADYCGNGRSHTKENTLIDMYDDLSVLTRATQAAGGWVPERGSFEAAWTTEGAWCLSRTRDGRAVDVVLAECPGVFETDTSTLGEGDRCAVRRKGAGGSKPMLLRNRSYGESAPPPPGGNPGR
jgi:hypothetical protein